MSVIADSIADVYSESGMALALERGKNSTINESSTRDQKRYLTVNVFNVINRDPEFDLTDAARLAARVDVR